ncbi:MAG TPA: hypothetical protein VGL46_14895 [Pseudonocardiaceae bacterium]|jgi:integrase
MLALAASGVDPRVSQRLCDADVAWLMLKDGPVSGLAFRNYTGSYVHRRLDARYETARRVREAMFPTAQVQVAYRLLLGMYSGVVADGLAELTLDDVDWAGDATIVLDYLKRRTGPESVTLPGKAVRLLERWLAHSSPLRRFAPDKLRGALWIAAESQANCTRSCRPEGGPAACRPSADTCMPSVPQQARHRRHRHRRSHGGWSAGS